MKSIRYILLFGAILITIYSLNYCAENSKESNAILDSTAFREMTTEQKTEVLSKIILGKRDPYKTQYLKISMRLSASPTKSVLWDGKIIDADNGLIKINTTVQGEKWNDFNSAGEYGIVYLAKDLFTIVSEATLDSLAISLRPE